LLQKIPQKIEQEKDERGKDKIVIRTQKIYDESGDLEHGLNCENFVVWILEGHLEPRLGKFVSWLREQGIDSFVLGFPARRQSGRAKA